MSHALIIHDNMIISRAIESRLRSLGFDSFAHTWTQARAMEAARFRHPDLVVVGGSIAGGSPAQTAGKFAEQFDVPVMSVEAGTCSVQRHLLQGAIMEQRFSLSDMDAAVAAARAPVPAVENSWIPAGVQARQGTLTARAA